MCGIFGCISTDAASIVLEGLRKLEYRGYDSAGLAATFNHHAGPVKTEKTIGYVSDLASKANGRFKGAAVCIGHTRWATHGGVTESNAHPHSSNDGQISIVHNGIIENASDLSERVKNLGYEVKSETDSEIIVHLLHHEIKTQAKTRSELDAFRRVVQMLRGSWAIAVISSEMKNILVARNGSPLVIGRGHKMVCVSSDIQPLHGICTEVAYVNDGDVLSIGRDSIIVSDDQIEPAFSKLEGSYEEQDTGIFSHLMEKEIHDQIISISNTIGGRLSADGSRAILGGMSLSPKEIRELDRINIVACGSAYFASLVGVEYIREYSDVTVDAFLSSEFSASKFCGKNTLTIAVSQSGETKDTLDALQAAKSEGGHVSAFCNVIGSTISRLAGNGAYLHSGTEYSVASTKVFTSMISLFAIFSLSISNVPKIKQKRLISGLRKLPNLVSKQLISDDGSIEKAVNLLTDSSFSIFIGRGISYPLAREGALKMMEVAYLPCLPFSGGELKHGPIALIEQDTPVIAIAPDDSTFTSMVSSIRECKARGAKIILITDVEGHECEFADIIISTQKFHPISSPVVNSIPLQLLAYNLGVKRDLNVDRPRNLAKSVTVS
jgi:glucosamine--fructose-6-phosphate aminotransferase (isomerizing)